MKLFSKFKGARILSPVKHTTTVDIIYSETLIETN